MTTLNESLFARVKSRVQEQPEHLNIYDWFSGPQGSACEQHGDSELPARWDMSDVERLRTELLGSRCGTTACIAGHAIVLATDEEIAEAMNSFLAKNYTPIEIPQLAARLLGIDNSGSAYDLFLLYRWDEDLIERYIHFDDPWQRALATAEVIDRFIAKHQNDDDIKTI